MSLSALLAAENRHISREAEEAADTSIVYGGDLQEASVKETSLKPLIEGLTIEKDKLRTSFSIADALRENAGIQVKDYGGIGGLKTVNIRSLGSEYTSVFIDGLQIENAQNMQVDLGRFNTADYSSVQIFSTNKSIPLLSAKEYGASVAVYMQSGQPVYMPNRKTAFKAGVQGGSFGLIAPYISVSRKLRKNIDMTFSGGLTSSNGKYKFHCSRYLRLPDESIGGYDTTLTRKNGDIISYRIEGRIGRTSGQDSWNISTYYYSSDRGLPGPVVRSASQLPGYGDRQTDKDFHTHLFWKHRFQRTNAGEHFQIAVKGKFARNYTRYKTDPEKNPQAYPVDVNYRQTTGYISISQFVPIFDWWSLNVAADAQYNILNGNPRHFSKPERLNLWGAVYSALRWKPVKISASVVYDFSSDWFDNSSAGAFTKENKNRSNFAPALNISITPLKRLEIEGFVKRSFRLPSFNDLYYTFVGNSELKSETAFQSDLGICHLWRITKSLGMTSKAEIYHNSVTDKIVAVPTSNQFRWAMFNIGKVKILGSDISLLLDYNSARSMATSGNKGITASLSLKYSYQKSIDRSDIESSSYGGQIPYIPLHSGSASAFAEYCGWRISFTAIVTGERWSSSANYVDYHIDRWWTCDASLSKSLGGILVSVGLRNLLNRQYEVVKGYPMPGFNVIAGAEYRF